MKITINMRAKHFNLNELVNINRTNRYGASSQKKRLMKEIYQQLKDQVKEKLDGVYEVTAVWRVATRNRDLDNMLLKNVFDAMQEFGLLENDNLKHIVKITHEFEIVKREQEGVDVYFTEIK